MVFDQEATSEIILRAKYILVVEGGSLSIGSEEEPFMGDAVIELYGDTKTIELPNYGAKVMLRICVKTITYMNAVANFSLIKIHP